MKRLVGTWVRGSRVVAVAVGMVATVAMLVVVFATPTEATPSRTHHMDVSGKWRMTLEMEVGRATPLLELVEKDGQLSGTYTGRYGSSPVEGTIDGKKLAFTVAMSSTALEFRGEIKDDGTLTGTAAFGEMGDVKWTAAREK